MKRVIVLATCNITDPMRPEGSESWNWVVGRKLRALGQEMEVEGLSMWPARYVRLRQEQAVQRPFDYLVIEISTAWHTMRTMVSRVQHSAPRPIRRGFVKATVGLTNWAGGPQKVWSSKKPGLRGRGLVILRDVASRVFKPQSLADPADMEGYIEICQRLCEENGARLIVFFAGARSQDPRHGWARDLIDDMSARLRRLHQKHGFAVIDMLPLLSIYPNPELMADNLHPNAAGHVRFGSEAAGGIHEIEKGADSSFWRTVGPESLSTDPEHVWSAEKEPLTVS